MVNSWKLKIYSLNLNSGRPRILINSLMTLLFLYTLSSINSVYFETNLLSVIDNVNLEKLTTHNPLVGFTNWLLIIINQRLSKNPIWLTISHQLFCKTNSYQTVRNHLYLSSWLGLLFPNLYKFHGLCRTVKGLVTN